MPRPGPVDRLRGRLEARAGAEVARALPASYQRLGRVALVRWPESLRAQFEFLARGLGEELGVEAVARWAGPVEGARRLPRLELLMGGSTETEVREDGVVYRFDAAQVLYSRGNRTERARMARVGRPGERVVDLFAGIGYFALPIARHGRPREVVAVEENPASFGYLRTNIERNGLGAVVRAVLGDNRSVELPTRAFDRVLLGYLPDASPWLDRSLGLLRPEGGTIHLHRVADARAARSGPLDELQGVARRADLAVRSVAERRVKAYGPGRDHRVLDIELGPAGARARKGAPS